MQRRVLAALRAALGYLALGCGVTLENPIHSN
jgi:hypothetical protein